MQERNLATGRPMRVIIAAMGFFATTSSLAGTIRHDVLDQQYLNLAADDDFQAVGRVTWNESGGGGQASGALIRDDWVLTAAHVVDGIDALGGGISSMEFALEGQEYAAAAWFPHPLWGPSGGESNLFAGWDIGLIHLVAKVETVVPAPLFEGQDELGRTATLVGFGATGTGLQGAVPGSAGTKRAGENVLDLVGLEASPGGIIGTFSHDRLMAADFDHPTSAFESTLGSTTALPLEYLTAGGDSGGGVYIDVGGVKHLAGVVSLASTLDANANSDYGDRAAFTRVSEFVNWIELTISNNSPQQLVGDFGGNGVVDAPDYNLWRDTFGSTTELAADGNGNGIVDAADYIVWRDNFGTTSSAAAAAIPVPEPPSLWLATICIIASGGMLLSHQPRGCCRPDLRGDRGR